MKTLVVFYSRTGTTKKVAEALASKMGADLEEIKDTVDRSGIKGYLFSGRDAMKKNLTVLRQLSKDVSQYDLVVIGTPIWITVSVPVRTFLVQHKNEFAKNVAFFCTMGGSGDEKAFKEMEEIVGKKPLATLTLRTRDVVKGNMEHGTEEFLSILKETE